MKLKCPLTHLWTRVALQRQSNLLPDDFHVSNELVDHLMSVVRSRRQAQLLLASWDGWVVDRLDVVSEFLNHHVRNLSAMLWVAELDWNDVRRSVLDWEAFVLQLVAQVANVVLMTSTQFSTFF